MLARFYCYCSLKKGKTNQSNLRHLAAAPRPLLFAKANWRNPRNQEDGEPATNQPITMLMPLEAPATDEPSAPKAEMSSRVGRRVERAGGGATIGGSLSRFRAAR